jgi:hypothetical protein
MVPRKEHLGDNSPSLDFLDPATDVSVHSEYAGSEAHTWTVYQSTQGQQVVVARVGIH